MKNKEKKIPIFKRLLPYSGKRIVFMRLSALFAILSAIFLVVPYYYLWHILDEVLDYRPNYADANIVEDAWLAFLFLLLSIALMFVALMCSHFCAFRTQKNIKKIAVEHAMSLSPGMFDVSGIGSVRRTIDDSADSIHGFLADQYPDLIRVRILPLIILIMVFAFDWRIGLAIIIPVVLTMLSLASMWGNDAVESSMREYMTAQMNISSAAVEYIRGVSVLKAFQQTLGSFKTFSKAIDNYHNFVLGYTKLARKAMIPAYVAIDSIFAFIMIVALFIMDGGSVSNEFLADLLFYVIFSPIVSILLLKIMFTSDQMFRVNDALGRLDNLLAMKPLEEPENPVEPNGYDIDFEEVSFTYAGAEKPAIENLNLHIASGKITALVGPSGSGKSTVASLASRFMDPSSGKVLLGGVDIKETGKANIRKAESCVFQNNHLISGTLAKNVRLGKPDATDEEVFAALSAAQCDDILAKLPNGIDTVLGPGGIYLSGGETQRIAIARAIVRDTPVVIMDEATAFADPENEHLVQKAFEKLAENKTVLIIAHRLTTVRNADLICVMDGGKIIESGTHDSLISMNGRYAGMWEDYQRTLSWKVKEVSA